MDRDLLAHLPVILAVARRKGFAAAAATLGISPSAVSHAVRVVEQRLGQPLFARTTRSVALTEAGERLVTELTPSIAAIERAFEAVRGTGGEVTGVLRLNTPRVALPLAVTSILARLARIHPKLTVEIHTEEAFVDIVAAGFDAGIRLGEAIAQDMVAVRLTPPFETALVAAPNYVDAFGAPASIDELDAHNCIGFRMVASGGVYDWEFMADGRLQRRPLHGTVRVTDAAYVRDLAGAGVGIGYVFEPLVRDDLAAGRLVRLLPETAVEEDGFFLYFPRRGADTPKLRAFVAAARREYARLEAPIAS